MQTERISPILPAMEDAPPVALTDLERKAANALRLRQICEELSAVPDLRPYTPKGLSDWTEICRIEKARTLKMMVVQLAPDATGDDFFELLPNGQTRPLNIPSCTKAPRIS